MLLRFSLKVFLFLFLFLLSFTIIVGGAFFILKDLAIKTAIEYTMTNLLGFHTTIHRLHFEYPGTFYARGVKIKNPKGFSHEIFADAPEIYLSMDLAGALRREHVYLYDLKIHLKNIDIEKNKKGIYNIELLEGPDEEEAEPSAVPKKKKPFHLARLELTVERVRYEDRSVMIPEKFYVNMEKKKEVFHGITNYSSLIDIILLKIIYGAAFEKPLNMSPFILKKSLKKTMHSGEEVFRLTAGFVAKGASKVTKGLVKESKAA